LLEQRFADLDADPDVVLAQLTAGKRYKAADGHGKTTNRARESMPPARDCGAVYRQAASNRATKRSAKQRFTVILFYLQPFSRLIVSFP
jgi:hypothetical protein